MHNWRQQRAQGLGIAAAVWMEFTIDNKKVYIQLGKFEDMENCAAFSVEVIDWCGDRDVFDKIIKNRIYLDGNCYGVLGYSASFSAVALDKKQWASNVINYIFNYAANLKMMRDDLNPLSYTLPFKKTEERNYLLYFLQTDNIKWTLNI